MQDSVKTDKFKYKVNNVALFQKNDELKKLCNNTKGKQIYITRNNDVYAYNKDGEQKIA